MKYKLTNQEMQTYNGFQWELGKWYEINNLDENEDLCSPYWFHFYHHPLLAVLLNTAHADIDNPRLFEIEIDGLQKDDNGLKGGCTRMKLAKEIELPEITTEQRVKFAIYCALEVYDDSSFVQWANDWLSGKDRSATTAAEAASAARAVAWVASAARATTAAEAATTAAEAATWAAWATTAAATARAATTAATEDIDLITIAQKAVR